MIRDAHDRAQLCGVPREISRKRAWSIPDRSRSRPLLPERAGDEGRVLYDAGALLGTPRAGRGSPLLNSAGSPGREQSLSRVVQSVPHRFVFDRGTVRPGVVAQVLFVVYEQRRVRIEGPLEEGHPFVQSVRASKPAACQVNGWTIFRARARKPQALLAPDQDLGMPSTLDAPHGDVRRVAHEVGALVAAFEAAPWKSRIGSSKIVSPSVLDYHFPDDVDLADLVQVHPLLSRTSSSMSFS